MHSCFRLTLHFRSRKWTLAALETIKPVFVLCSLENASQRSRALCNPPGHRIARRAAQALSCNNKLDLFFQFNCKEPPPLPAPSHVPQSRGAKTEAGWPSLTKAYYRGGGGGNEGFKDTNSVFNLKKKKARLQRKVYPRKGREPKSTRWFCSTPRTRPAEPQGGWCGPFWRWSPASEMEDRIL